MLSSAKKALIVGGVILLGIGAYFTGGNMSGLRSSVLEKAQKVCTIKSQDEARPGYNTAVTKKSAALSQITTLEGNIRRANTDIRQEERKQKKAKDDLASAKKEVTSLEKYISQRCKWNARTDARDCSTKKNDLKKAQKDVSAAEKIIKDTTSTIKTLQTSTKNDQGKITGLNKNIATYDKIILPFQKCEDELKFQPFVNVVFRQGDDLTPAGERFGTAPIPQEVQEIGGTTYIEGELKMTPITTFITLPTDTPKTMVSSVVHAWEVTAPAWLPVKIDVVNLIVAKNPLTLSVTTWQLSSPDLSGNIPCSGFIDEDVIHVTCDMRLMGNNQPTIAVDTMSSYKLIATMEDREGIFATKIHNISYNGGRNDISNEDGLLNYPRALSRSHAPARCEELQLLPYYDGATEYFCTVKNASQAKVVIKKPDGSVLQTLGTIWDFTLGTEIAPGMYTVDCLINDEEAPSYACSREYKHCSPADAANPSKGCGIQTKYDWYTQNVWACTNGEQNRTVGCRNIDDHRSLPASACKPETKPLEKVSCGGTSSICGNGTKEWTEQCDDGNTNNGDGCSNTCTNTLGSLLITHDPNNTLNQYPKNILAGEPAPVFSSIIVSSNESVDVGKVVFTYSAANGDLSTADAGAELWLGNTKISTVSSAAITSSTITFDDLSGLIASNTAQDLKLVIITNPIGFEKAGTVVKSDDITEVKVSEATGVSSGRDIADESTNVAESSALFSIVPMTILPSVITPLGNSSLARIKLTANAGNNTNSTVGGIPTVSLDSLTFSLAGSVGVTASGFIFYEEGYAAESVTGIPSGANVIFDLSSLTRKTFTGSKTYIIAPTEIGEDGTAALKLTKNGIQYDVDGVTGATDIMNALSSDLDLGSRSY